MIEVCSDREEWDRMVRNSPQGSIFHTWDWLKIVEKHTSSKLLPLVGLKGSTPIGIYPLFIKKRYTIKIALSPPSKSLLLYLGPAFIGYESLKQSKKESLFTDFQSEVDEFIEDVGCKFVRVRTSPLIPDCRPLKWNGYEVEPLYTYRIDLRRGIEKVWADLNRKLRVGIEKTKKSGVKVVQGDEEDLEDLRIALYERFVEQGRASKGYYREYLRDLFRAFYPENMKIFVAKLNGETVGGLVALFFKRWSGLWIGIPKTRLKGVYPNDLAQWEAIKWACENGFECYEEMDAGHIKFRHFKAKFNPEAVPWFSAKKFLGVYRILGKILCP